MRNILFYTHGLCLPIKVMLYRPTWPDTATLGKPQILSRWAGQYSLTGPGGPHGPSPPCCRAFPKRQSTPAGCFFRWGGSWPPDATRSRGATIHHHRRWPALFFLCLRILTTTATEVI